MGYLLVENKGEKLSRVGHILDGVLRHVGEQLNIDHAIYGAGSGDLAPLSIARYGGITIDPAPVFPSGWNINWLLNAGPVNMYECLIESTTAAQRNGFLGNVSAMVPKLERRYRHKGYLNNEEASTTPVTTTALASLLFTQGWIDLTLINVNQSSQDIFDFSIADGSKRAWRYWQNGITPQNSLDIKRTIRNFFPEGSGNIAFISKGDMCNCTPSIFDTHVSRVLIQENHPNQAITPGDNWKYHRMSEFLPKIAEVIGSTVKYGYGDLNHAAVWAA